VQKGCNKEVRDGLQTAALHFFLNYAMVRRWVRSKWSAVSDVIIWNPRQWNCNVYCQEDWICGDYSDSKCDCSSGYDYAIGTGREWRLTALPANTEMFISLIVPETWVAGWIVGRWFWEEQTKTQSHQTRTFILIKNMHLTFRGPCIVIYSYNKSQQYALFLKFILVKNSTCFGHTYCPSSGVLILYSQ